MTQCVPINFYNRDLLQKEPNAEFYYPTGGSGTEWFGAATVESYAPERNATYAVLDSTLASRRVSFVNNEQTTEKIC